jgi:dTMP kinase
MSDLITFEGGEGAGKTTLIEKLFTYLTSLGVAVIKTREPGGTRLGKSIRDLLLHRSDFSIKARAELFLFLADRAQHVEEVIRPALNKGTIVLCDRFNDSSLAYQAGARHLNLKTLRELCQFAVDGLEPALTFYLDIDPTLARQRLAPSSIDRIESENGRFHEEVRAAFLRIAAEEPQRIKLIDATASPESVFQQAKVAIDVLLSRR